METKKLKHPSFGQISFCRTSGNTNFYGSNLQSNHYITMTVSSSELYKDLTDEKYFEREQLIRIRMTSLQFSELITNMNASGIPCTIERLGNKMVENLPIQESRKEFVQSAFQERMNEVAEKLSLYKDKFSEIANKKGISKKDSEEILKTYQQFMQEIKSNIPFFSTCFQESMDKIIVEAKNEIDSAINSKIYQTGLEELFKQQNLILNK